MPGFILKTPPSEEPIDVQAAKLFLKVDHDLEDDFIKELIVAAREWVEGRTGRALITQTWQFVLDNFPNAFGYGTVMGSPGFGQGYAGWIPGYARGANVNIWFANGIVSLPFPKLRKVNSIKYIDRANVLQTIDPATYVVDIANEPGRIAPVPTAIWPFTQLSLLAPALNAITIDFECGYGDSSSDVPSGLKLIMKMLIAHWYANRETVITGVRAAAVEVPLTAEALIWRYRNWIAV